MQLGESLTERGGRGGGSEGRRENEGYRDEWSVAKCVSAYLSVNKCVI